MSPGPRAGSGACDVGLPGMDGYAVAKASGSEPGVRDTFIVALTGTPFRRTSGGPRRRGSTRT